MAEATTALTVAEQRSGPIVVGFATVEGYEGLQRVAKAFAASSLVPDAFKGNIANCVIAVEMASRMGASPLMVMQNLYLVHGRPGWSSQFLIASFNESRRFSPIRYRWTGTPNTPSWGCIAWAKETSTGGVCEGPEVTIAMAKAEGWIDKPGSKWKTIPQLMLTYRAATFFVRTTAPELAMGLKTTDELDDIAKDVTPKRPPQRGVVASVPAPEAPAEDPITDAEVVAEGEPVPTVAESIAVQIHAARSMDDLVSCAKSIAVGMETGKVAPQEKAALDDIYTAKRKDLLAPAKTATVAAA